MRYTIIAGNQHPAVRLSADVIDATADRVPWSNRWGFYHTERALERAADKLRDRKSKSDGPVTIKSASLPGVEDFVVLRADHASLYYPTTSDRQPAAWETIKDRLNAN